MLVRGSIIVPSLSFSCPFSLVDISLLRVIWPLLAYYSAPVPAVASHRSLLVHISHCDATNHCDAS